MSVKKQKVKNIRNILNCPFKIQWEQNNLEEVVLLQNTLTELLPYAKLEEKVFKKQLRNKKERTEKDIINTSHEKENIYRTFLTLGFQSVLRGLEKKELCCALVAADISPALLQKALIGYLVTHNIPFIIIPDLKAITRCTLGFSTMALGFKEIVRSSENIFNPIYKLILQNPTQVEAPFIVLQSSDEHTINNTDELVKMEVDSSSPSLEKTNPLYLYRKNINERVFTPKSVTDAGSCKVNQKIDKMSSEDYISVGMSLQPQKQKLPTKIENLKLHYHSDEDEENSEDENMFFVDKKPDESLLKNSETSIETNKSKKGNSKDLLNTNFKYTKHKQNENKFKKDLENNYTDASPGLISAKFYPLSIKTVKSNPKKVRKKKKHNTV